jgi:hypothetical protein
MHVTGFDLECGGAEGFLQFTQNAGQDVLASRRSGADAKANVSPTAKAFDRLGGGIQIGEGLLDTGEKMLASVI